VIQGVISFRYWTGQDPDRPVLRAALEVVFGG
ncbi:MAG: shikimate dehydrogenase, partial [Acidobacteria bacterium]|nr:shikimate dehydrogenase [Acidobacteriota bacterium]